MRFDQSTLHSHPPQLSLNHANIFLAQSYPLLFSSNPLSPLSVACVCMVVGASTGAWATYQWPHPPKYQLSFSPSSYQLPQLWAGPPEPLTICAGGLTMKSAFLVLSSGVQGIHLGG